jgi:signal transduction histidine kinase
LDEEKFERIMLNLLSNSLKFTPSGKNINISIEEKKLENKKFISISIEDEGIGIPDEKQKLIFERFGQADTSLSRQAEGTGLGLYLVNILVNILDGKIELESEPGKGSKFTILLPIITSLSKKEENYSGVDNQLMSSDERIIHATSIEFSDIYFD